MNSQEAVRALVSEAMRHTNIWTKRYESLERVSLG